MLPLAFDAQDEIRRRLDPDIECRAVRGELLRLHPRGALELAVAPGDDRALAIGNLRGQRRQKRGAPRVIHAQIRTLQPHPRPGGLALHRDDAESLRLHRIRNLRPAAPGGWRWIAQGCVVHGDLPEGLQLVDERVGRTRHDLCRRFHLALSPLDRPITRRDHDERGREDGALPHSSTVPRT
jgi:hypothetical protein